MSLHDRLATANTAARKVADEGRAGGRQRRVELLERPTLTFSTAPLPPSDPPASSPATVAEPRPKFVRLTLASLILGIVGVVFSAVPILNAFTMLGAIVGVVLGGIALFGSRKRLAAIGTVSCVLAVVFTASSSTTAANRPVGPAPSPAAPHEPVELPAASPTPQIPAALQVPPAPPTPISTTTGGRQAVPAAPAERVAKPSERTTMHSQPVAPRPAAAQPVASRPVTPQPAASRPVTPQPDNDSSGGAVYYKNCAAAQAAGAAPIKSGEPGYRSGLDRDQDGIACDE